MAAHKKRITIFMLMLALTVVSAGCGERAPESGSDPVTGTGVSTGTNESQSLNKDTEKDIDADTDADTDNDTDNDMSTSVVSDSVLDSAESGKTDVQQTPVDLSNITAAQLLDLLDEPPAIVKAKLHAETTFREGANRVREWGYSLDMAEQIERVWVWLQYPGDLARHLAFLGENMAGRIISLNDGESEESLWQLDGKGYNLISKATTFNDEEVVDYSIDTNRRSGGENLYEKDLLNTALLGEDPLHKTFVQGVFFADALMTKGAFYAVNCYSTRTVEESLERYTAWFSTMPGFEKTQGNGASWTIKAKTVEEDQYSYRTLEIVIYSTEGREIDVGDGNQYQSQMLIQVR